jgi:hypothetical protein
MLRIHQLFGDRMAAVPMDVLWAGVAGDGGDPADARQVVVGERRLVQEPAVGGAGVGGDGAVEVLGGELTGAVVSRTLSVGLTTTRWAGRDGSARRRISSSTAASPTAARGGLTAVRAGLYSWATSSS